MSDEVAGVFKSWVLLDGMCVMSLAVKIDTSPGRLGGIRCWNWLGPS
jgi:hypothetical protein